MMKDLIQRDALNYHSEGRPGKIAIKPTKPLQTQRDLALAYSPGVAQPCLEIAEDVSRSFKYTARGNLVAVISNGTAVLGLGNSLPLSKQATRDQPNSHTTPPHLTHAVSAAVTQPERATVSCRWFSPVPAVCCNFS